MSMENYKRAWNSQTEKDPDSFRVELERLAAKLDRSYRRERAMLAVCVLNTCIAMSLAIWILVRQPSVDWSEVWPVIAVQIIGIVGLAILLRRHMRRRRAQGWSGAPVREAVRLALEDIAGEVRNIKLLLTAGLVMAPLLFIAVEHLSSAGKMNERAVAGFGLLCAAVVGINAVVMTAKYRRSLRPRRQRLEQILASLEQDALHC
jgi:Flp pilus assembly protein TadB